MTTATVKKPASTLLREMRRWTAYRVQCWEDFERAMNAGDVFLAMCKMDEADEAGRYLAEAAAEYESLVNQERGGVAS